MEEKIIRAEPELSRERTWQVLVPRLLAGGIGVVLLAAALSKSMDMPLFIRQIGGYGIISHRFFLTLSAWGIITIEFGLGIGLLIFYRPRLILLLTALLFLVFLCVTVWAWLTGATMDCGCFGAWLKRTPGQAVVEDLILLVATFTAFFGSRHLPQRGTRAGLWAVMVACLIGIALPAVFGFSLSQRGRSGWEALERELNRLQIHDIRPIDFRHGAFLLILIDTECQHCREAVGDLNRLAKADDIPPVIALCMNDENLRMDFTEKYKPVFSIGRISEDLFWRLLGDGDVPRTLLLRDLKIKQVWDQVTPKREEIKKRL